jgi:3',5'-cyclic AMP phosphodiesterase CpdA
VTDRGRAAEHGRFEELFGALEREGRISVVPGNHDRLGDDMGARLMRGGRVEARTIDGVYLVRVDSTGDHNRFLLAGHGEIDEEVIDRVDLALAAAPRKHLVVVLLHHHLLPSGSRRGSAGPGRSRSGWASRCSSGSAAAATWCCTDTGTCRAR